MILWRQTQNKKMLRYLNKQNFNVSFIDVGKKARNGKMTYLMSDTTLLLKGVSTRSSIDNVD